MTAGRKLYCPGCRRAMVWYDAEAFTVTKIGRVFIEELDDDDRQPVRRNAEGRVILDELAWLEAHSYSTAEIRRRDHAYPEAPPRPREPPPKGSTVVIRVTCWRCSRDTSRPTVILRDDRDPRIRRNNLRNRYAALSSPQREKFKQKMTDADDLDAIETLIEQLETS